MAFLPFPLGCLPSGTGGWMELLDVGTRTGASERKGIPATV